MIFGAGRRRRAAGALARRWPTAPTASASAPHHLGFDAAGGDGHRASPATVAVGGDHRLGELRPRRCGDARAGSRSSPGVHELAPGAADRASSSTPRTVFVFAAGRPARRRAVAPRRLRRRAWRGSTSTTSRIPTCRDPQGRTDYALKPIDHVWQARRRLRAARALGLRQDHAAQHHLGPGPPDARAGPVRRRATSLTLPTEQRNIAQVFQFPVDLRHDDGLREPRLPACATAAWPRPTIEARVERDRPTARPRRPMLDRKARGLTADAKQKISLGPRPGARRRRGRSCSTSR